MADNFVAAWSVDRGRSYELDKTGTGTATCDINDTHGVIDPTNASGPYYGLIQPLQPAAFALFNPVASTYSTVFRGFTEAFTFDVDGSQKVTRTQVRFVDGMDILANAEMVQDGNWGDTPPTGSAGDVFYASSRVDDRINQALDDAGWPSGAREIFSGNVILKDTIYSPNTDVLQVILDAADAEFPGVANFFISKDGKATFHGRLARFDPTNPDYGLGSWKCGDGAAVAGSISDTAQIRGFTFSRDKDKIINSASATPQGIADAAIPGQLSTDAPSIALYGTRSWSADNLLTDSGILTGLDDLGETKLFADYYVANFNDPQNRVESVTFRSLPPEDPRASALWALLCGVEISDQISVTVTHPGGGGFNLEPYFVEGMHYDVRPLAVGYPDVTLTLDLSPAAYFTTAAGLDGA